MEPRKGDWIQTRTGRAFWPLDPRPSDIDIEDIAHALSMICRFGGHSTLFYSVAEHSWHVARSVPPADRLWALLHDAAEAYIADVPRPIKPFLLEYDAIERGIQLAVCQRFKLDPRTPESVRRADFEILSDEAAQIMAPFPRPWKTHSAGLGVKIHAWGPERAKREFLNAFRIYAGRTE